MPTPAGLTIAEAQARLQRDGANEVPEKRSHPLLRLAKKFWGLSAWMIELIALDAIGGADRRRRRRRQHRCQRRGQVAPRRANDAATRPRRLTVLGADGEHLPRRRRARPPRASTPAARPRLAAGHAVASPSAGRTLMDALVVGARDTAAVREVGSGAQQAVVHRIATDRQARRRDADRVVDRRVGERTVRTIRRRRRTSGKAVVPTAARDEERDYQGTDSHAPPHCKTRAVA